MKRAILCSALVLLPALLSGCWSMLSGTLGVAQVGAAALKSSPKQREDPELQTRNRAYREVDREYRSTGPGTARRTCNRQKLYHDYHQDR